VDYVTTSLTSVLLADGWHDVTAGSLVLDEDPSFTDPATGLTATPVGGAWMRFTDPTGAVLAAPLSRIQAIRADPAQPPAPPA
jgi:hypothetical protein